MPSQVAVVVAAAAVVAAERAVAVEKAAAVARAVAAVRAAENRDRIAMRVTSAASCQVMNLG